MYLFTEPCLARQCMKIQNLTSLYRKPDENVIRGTGTQHKNVK